MIILRACAFILGIAGVAATLLSVTRVLLVPRSAPDPLVRVVFLAMRFFFLPWTRDSRPYAERDRVMAFYAPLSLLAILPAWLTLILVAYTSMFRAIGVPSWREAFRASGSSLMYSAFSRREAAVTLLEVRAGSPPSAVEMIERYHRIHGLDRLSQVWQTREALISPWRPLPPGLLTGRTAGGV